MKILIFYRHFPVAMGRYLHWGLEQAGHEVISAGPYSEGKIPWGDMEFPKKWWYPPTIQTPDIPEIDMDDLFLILRKQKWDVDLVIQAADTIFLKGKAPVKNILIGTDPHVIDYYPHLTHVDKYFSMQKTYSRDGDGWLPYAYDPGIHKYIPDTPIKYDVVLSGLLYEHRKDALKAMSDQGLSVFCGLGYIYDDYVNLYNSGAIAFNWSSREDLPARFWEGLAMRRAVLTNRTPELRYFDFKEDVDYIGFDSVDEAVAAAKLLVKKPQILDKIAKNGYKKVQKHTYKNRMTQFLKEIE